MRSKERARLAEESLARAQRRNHRLEETVLWFARRAGILGNYQGLDHTLRAPSRVDGIMADIEKVREQAETDDAATRLKISKEGTE